MIGRGVPAAGWCAGLLVSLSLVGPTRLSAQADIGRASAGAGGIEARHLTLGQGLAIRRITQAALPVGVVLTGRRFGLDIGTYWVTTTVERDNRRSRTVADFTDTQVRGTAVLGRDAVVASIMVNLPTGRYRLSAEDQTLLSTASSSLFAFPVSSYGNGFSVTAGLAGAMPVGSWNLGLAASLRANAEYTPFVDSLGPFTYRAGIEGRFRAGMDRLLGASRLSLGVTVSTFADDEFAIGNGRVGAYQPGSRYIVEATLAAPLGVGTLSTYGWAFHRAAGDTLGGRTANAEDLFAVGAVATLPISPNLAWQPGLEARVSDPDEGSAFLAGGSIGLRIRLDRAFSLVPTFRFEAGILKDDQEARHALRMVSASVYLRRSF